jgi:hypothetical protein
VISADQPFKVEAKYSYTELAYEFAMNDEPSEKEAFYGDENEGQKLMDAL